MSKIVSFANQKGGVGKTTTCLNLANYIALMGKKVLLLDLDPQGNATTGLGFNKEDNQNNVYNLIAGDLPVNECIHKTDIQNLFLIPSSMDLAGIEVEMVYMNEREKILTKILSEVKNSYDYIFIDCPPSLNLLTINSLTASDSILIPIQCEFFALEGLSQLMNTVRLVKKHLNKDLAIEGVVLTMKDKRSNFGNQVADEIRKYFADSLYETMIPRNIRLAEAPSHGVTIYQYDKSCAGAKAYEELAVEFLKRNKDSYKKITKNKKNTRGKKAWLKRD